MKEKLNDIKAFIFDNDGVLSKDYSPLNEEGIPMRTSNIKDGFAIYKAIKEGFIVAVITGAKNKRVKNRYKDLLNVHYYYDGVIDKITCIKEISQETGIALENMLYMGDDLIDYEAMSAVGMPVCPKDAVYEIKDIAKYISDKKGGEGCVRDIIEQTLRAQKKWFTKEQLLKTGK